MRRGSNSQVSHTEPAGGTWRELLGPRNLGASTVLAGGVALYATNEFITISLLPSVVDEIGGHRLYAWVMTVYLVSSVAAATTVSGVLARLGPRRAYLVGLSFFALGTLLCALAPTMPLLLAARVLQGGAGGFVAGLGYAVINTALPPALWTRASALVSAMWGVGTLVGPAAGGLFAQFGVWRWAFGSLAIVTAAMVILVPIALPARDAGPVRQDWRIPIASLLLLGTGALLVSAAGSVSHLGVTVALLAGGVAAVAVFLAVDRRMSTSVLPSTAFRPGPLKWMYVTLGVLMAATMVDVYVPLFGQRLAGLTPVAAGFLAVALSLGWTLSEIGSASVDKPPAAARIVRVAPLVMAAGLLVAALTQRAGAGPGLVAVWAVALFVAGTGIGMAWPHLSAWAMGAVEDPDEGPVAAAAINTVQLMSAAFGAGLAGVLVNVTRHGDVAAARWAFGTFAVLAALGWLASSRAARR